MGRPSREQAEAVLADARAVAGPGDTLSRSRPLANQPPEDGPTGSGRAKAVKSPPIPHWSHRPDTVWIFADSVSGWF